MCVNLIFLKNIYDFLSHSLYIDSLIGVRIAFVSAPSELHAA